MPNEIKINAFTGMQNIKESGSLFVKKGVAEPRIILNSDVTSRGRLVKRDGYTKVISLTAPHSMWAGDTCHLCVSENTLYRINGLTATSIGAVTANEDYPLFYVEIDGLVYFSSRWCNGTFNPATDSIGDWGLTLPNGPMLTSRGGGLSEGVYHVCLTVESDGEISGNGPIAQINLSSTGGIHVSNRGANNVVWCTDPNGDIFYRIGKVDTINNIPAVEPLPSMFCYPPPYVQHLTHAFGLMWGSVGNKVYYSEPFKWAWWKKGTAFFEFATDVTMIAKSKTGLFVGCKDRTYSLLGSSPEEIQQTDVGAGAIPGTLVYANNVIEMGDTISPSEKKHSSVPIWLSEAGFVAGNPVGRLFSLSQGKVKFAPGKRGASLYRQKNGDIQILSSFYKGSDDGSIGISDEATVTVIRDGRVI